MFAWPFLGLVPSPNLVCNTLLQAIEPALEPILQRAVFKQGGRLLINIGDTEVDYDEGFGLFM